MMKKQVQEPSLVSDALESKKRKLSMYEQALSEEKRKMTKLEREKSKVMLEIDQHKILDGKIKNVKSALEKAKTKNKLAEAELNKLKSTISNDTKQQRETNIKVEQSW